MPRLSIILRVHGQGFDAVRETARRAEALGFAGVWVPDHSINSSAPKAGVLECWTTLSAIAATTERIPIGPLVLTTGFHEPTLLAKQATTLASIAPRRLRLGLGSGGFTYAETCRRLGRQEMTPAARVAHCRDTLECLRAVWSGDEVDWRGEFGELRGATLQPRPKERPPLLVAARKPGMLDLTATLADGWNCPLPSELGSLVPQMHSRLEAEQRDPAGFHISAFSILVLDHTEEGALSALKDAGKSAQLYGDVQTEHLFGTPDRVGEKIERWGELGVGEVTLDLRGPDPNATMEMLANDVVPGLRDRASATGRPG